MPPARLTPFDLVFQEAADTIFPALRRSLSAAGRDPRNRDAFLMEREVVTLIHDLRPEEGLGTGIDQLSALVHHAYLFWDAGQMVVGVSREELTPLLVGDVAASSEVARQPPSYAQLPLRRIWAQVVAGLPPEPLDGCFMHAVDPANLSVLGVFGVHPDRPGFSVVEVSGARPSRLQRRDGSVLFSPLLPGGAEAGLFSVAGEEELLELGWRLQDIPRTWEVPAEGSDSAAPADERSHLPASSS
jgi:hypothetical protein